MKTRETSVGADGVLTSITRKVPAGAPGVGKAIDPDVGQTGGPRHRGRVPGGREGPDDRRVARGDESAITRPARSSAT